MQAPQAFKQLLDKKICPVLEIRGFSPKGQTFYLRRDGNWGLIDFQRSTKSSSAAVIFTVNLGIASARLLRFFAPKRFSATHQDAKPLISDCHWRQRLGHLLPNHSDLWWTVDTQSRLEQLALEIEEDLRLTALPEIERYTSDEALRELWLGGRSPGLSELQRLMNLSVLLKALGPMELLEHVLNELESIAERTRSGSVVRVHVQRLEQGDVE